MAACWTALLLIGCWWPAELMPVDESSAPSFEIPHLDKLIHASLFAGFAFLWFRGGRPSPRRAALVLSASLSLAVVTEIGQAVPPVNRDPDVGDALADSAGAALGLAVAWMFRPRGEEGLG